MPKTATTEDHPNCLVGVAVNKRGVNLQRHGKGIGHVLCVPGFCRSKFGWRKERERSFVLKLVLVSKKLHSDDPMYLVHQQYPTIMVFRGIHPQFGMRNIVFWSGPWRNSLRWKPTSQLHEIRKEIHLFSIKLHLPTLASSAK